MLNCRNAQFELGIVIYDAYTELGYNVYSLTERGELRSHIPNDIMGAIANVFDKDLVSRCGRDEIPVESRHLMARVVILRRLREIRKETEDIFNGLALPFSTLHSRVCHSDPDKWTDITVDQVADIVVPKRRDLDPWRHALTMLCVQEHMIRRSGEYVMVRTSFYERKMVHVRPKAHVERLQTVRQMMAKRTTDPRLQAFTKKARRLIEKNRVIQAASKGEPPTRTLSEEDPFTEDDQMIIRFLMESMYLMRGTQHDPYGSLVCAIVKGIDGMYEGDVNNAQVHQLLVELGVYAPWQDYVSNRLEFGLDQESEEASPLVKQTEELLRRGMLARATQKSDSALLGPEELYPSDRMASIRHDFGDLPAYVIDDHGAEELDDAVSIETIPDEPQNLWIHNHIADPTYLLPPTHLIAQEARRLGETLYFLHRTWPMLPRALVDQSLSMGDMAAQGKPEMTLTFSTKIDENGEILDYKVRSGLLRNVHVLKYDDVDKAIGLDAQRSHITYPLGGTPTPATETTTIDFSPQDHENFRLFRLFLQRMQDRINRLPIAMFTTPRAQLTVTSKPLPPSNLALKHSTPFRGFPDVTYTVDRNAMDGEGSRLIIAEAAKLACRVASLYCLERGVPIMRRGSPQPLMLSDSDFERMLSMRDEKGFVMFWEAASLHAKLVGATTELEPMEHWALGIPANEGYVRVTSPLRRYQDLLAHWQIKESLLNDAGHGTGSGKPLFSTQDLFEYLEASRYDEMNRKRLFRQHDVYWSLMTIKRWLAEQPEGMNALGVLEARPLAPPRIDRLIAEKMQPVSIPSLGIEAFLAEKGPLNTTLGAPVNVKIDRIIVGSSSRMIVVLA